MILVRDMVSGWNIIIHILENPVILCESQMKRLSRHVIRLFNQNLNLTKNVLAVNI